MKKKKKISIVWGLHIGETKNLGHHKRHTCEILFPRSIIDAASEAAFS